MLFAAGFQFIYHRSLIYFVSHVCGLGKSLTSFVRSSRLRQVLTYHLINAFEFSQIIVLRRRNSGQADPAEPPTVQTSTPVSSSVSYLQSVPVQTDITDMAARKR